MSGCLGDAVAALVDGELDHAARERAHRHLAHCSACRAEVETQRRVKARLRGAGAPAAPDALTVRLLGLTTSRAAGSLTAPGGRPEPLPVGGAPRTGSRRQRSAAPVRGRRGPSLPALVPRGASGPACAPAPAGRPGRPRALRRRATAGSAFALLGVAAALAFGAPPQRQPSTPVDPSTDAFVTELVSTTGSTSPSSRLPDGTVVPFLPVTRASLMSSDRTTGGAGSPW